MATAEPLGRLVGQLRRTAEANSLADTGDAELLDRYRKQHDAAAFEAIVRRHGPLVLTACRRVLGSAADVDDVFQATFLVLLHKAQSIRRQNSLGSWLYGVAHRLAVTARDSAARRQRLERRVGKPVEADSSDVSWREACALLHRELDRLPDKYRLPLLLCYLEGQSRDQAARKLGCSMNVVRGRLERGRQLLRSRLAKRGVALSAGLIATLGDSATAEGLPPSLVQATVRAVGGRPSAAAAALLRGASTTMIPRSVKLIAGFLLAASLVVGAVALRPVTPASANPPTPAPEGAKPQAGDATTYAGRVVDPEGKPVAGAKLYAVYYTPKVLPIPVRGTSDKDGGFRFAVEHKEFDRTASARPWDEVIVFAVAEGFGLSFPEFDPTKTPDLAHLTLKLTKDDAPIGGNITDLQGKPVRGVSVTINQLWLPSQTNDLSALLAVLKAKRALTETMIEQKFVQTGIWMGRDVGRILPPAVTDSEGKFTLNGIGCERVVGLRIDGPMITTAEFWGMTHPGDNLDIREHVTSDKTVRLVGTNFEHVAAPAQPIVGKVADKDTGKPIAGATVEGIQVRQMSASPTVKTVTDKDGRYRLAGLPKGPGCELRVRPPQGEPYLTVMVNVPDGPGLVPVTLDVALKRGVWISGKVTANGKPVAGMVQYGVHSDNPNLQAAPDLALEFEYHTNPAGSFRLVGLPGRGIVTAQAFETGYRSRVGADKIKDLDRFTIPIGRAIGMLNAQFNAVAEVIPEKDAESATCDLALVPGMTLSGTVVDADGKPLSGVRIRGLSHPELWDEPEADGKFTVKDVKPEEPRLIQFLHTEKKLAGSVVVRGDEKNLTVKLEAAAVLTGRFVTSEGKPLAELQIVPITMPPLADPRMPPKFDTTAGSFPRGVRTDKDGRFRIEGLAGGLKYKLAVWRGAFVLSPDGAQAKAMTLKAGETKDLGELRVKLPGEE
jgi:RNA polymerase sigma factor (sigma-70 family)